MVVPRAMFVRALKRSCQRSAPLIVAWALGPLTAGCSSQKEPGSPPIGQTREDGIVGREIEAPTSPEVAEPSTEEAALTRQELNALAAEQEEARQAEWARSALAEVASPSNDLGVVVVVAQRASDLPWLLAVQNRGDKAVSLVALPELLSFEVIPPDDAPAAAPTEPAASTSAKAQPAKTSPTKAQAAPPPVVCGAVPKEVSVDSRVTLLPSEILVYPFDPRGYCDESEVLEAGAMIKPRYGFPLETKKVWRKGKLTEEVLPAKAPLAFELAPAAGTPAVDPARAPSAPAPQTPGASAASDATPAPVFQLKHVEAPSFVLDDTYPLERIAPLGRIEAATTADGGPAPVTAAPEEAGAPASSPESAPPPPPPPPLTLTIRPLGATANPGGSTVTVTAKNTSGRSMRLFLRRELISYQVTGPAGPTTCRMSPGARAPAPAAYSNLAAGASLSLTTRLAEACPKGTFDVPGSYTVFARIDAQNDGREHGFVAFTGTAITQQPAALTVRGTGVQSKPVMRVTSGR